jgi:hypothetical protein
MKIFICKLHYVIVAVDRMYIENQFVEKETVCDILPI